MEVFRQLAKACRVGVRSLPDGVLPVAKELPSIIDSHAVEVIISPLPRASAPRSAPPSANSIGVSSQMVLGLSRRAQKRKRSQEAKPTGRQPRPPPPHPVSRARTGDKATGASQRVAMPRMLIGHESRLPPGHAHAGEPLRFVFNLPGGCNAAGAGAKCPRG